MGWLSGIAAAIAVGAVSQPLFKTASDHSVRRLSELLLDQADSVAMTLGCILVLGSAVCFLAQRVKITTRYGGVCDRLLAGEDPTTMLRSLTGWKAWRLYKWAVDLLIIGVIEISIGFVAVAYRASHPRNAAEPEPWLLAISLAACLAVLSFGGLRLVRRLT